MLKKIFIPIPKILLIAVLWLLSSSLQAQETTPNPFDIGKTTITMPKDSVTTAPKIDSTQIATGNPFDIVAPKANNDHDAIKNVVKEIVVQPVEPSKMPQRFLFGLVLGILLLLTVLVSISRNLLSKIYQSFFNDVILKTLYRERSSLTTSIYISLYAMFILNLGVFFYLCLRHYGYIFNNSDALTLLYCIGGTAILFIGKHLMLGTLSSVFPISKEIDTYSFILVVFGILVGLMLAPINVFFAYSDNETAAYVSKIMLIVLAVIYILSALRSLFLVRNYILLHFFHFLLYLCSVEVIPLLILYKIINSKLQVPIF